MMLAKALVVLSSTTEDGEIKIRISVGGGGGGLTRRWRPLERVSDVRVTWYTHRSPTLSLASVRAAFLLQFSREKRHRRSWWASVVVCAVRVCPGWGAMQAEATTLSSRVRTKLARLSDRLRKDDEPEGVDGPCEPGETAPRGLPPRHLLRHILSRGGTTPDISCEPDSDPEGGDGPIKLLSQHRFSDTECRLSGEEPSDEEDGVLVGGSRPRRSPLPPRAITLAECPSPPSPPSPPAPPATEGASAGTEVGSPEGGILEKLGQRLKERSDRVHRRLCHSSTRAVSASTDVVTPGVVRSLTFSMFPFFIKYTTYFFLIRRSNAHTPRATLSASIATVRLVPVSLKGRRTLRLRYSLEQVQHWFQADIPKERATYRSLGTSLHQ
uniref:(California timema) hypothetical protein n=1 Tax=Timema californicum TaxID=61474 RepID=A0A7R9J1G9_TIMCA|nr:unnamed protein product [Timema californicum]